MAYIGREPTYGAFDYGAFEKQTLVGTNNQPCTAR